jgi:hypothetical protein
MYLYETVKKILETAIDSLIDNFAREPYLHRCEHSIHCELYNMLIVHRALQGLYPLKNGTATEKKSLQGRSTTLIHKEWPETIYRPEKKGIRGNFDLAILDPEKIPEYEVKDFTIGVIPPTFVVEMGLNYWIDHLKNDDYKLTNSKCENGYLIHLQQPHKGIKKKDEDELRDWIDAEPGVTCTGRLPKTVENKSNHKVAAVVFFKEGPMIKHLNEKNLTKYIRER